MGKLTVFNFITLNGYYQGHHGDIGWHRHGREENEFSAGNLKSGNILLFGRVTYDMMAGYWPTPMAIKNDPVVAEGMNKAEKIVFSRTLKKAGWENTMIMNTGIVKEIKKMKKMPGKNMTLLGSGSILTQFAEAGIIDEFIIMVDPVVIGKGTPIFNDIGINLELKLAKTRTFNSGAVLLYYKMK